MPEADKHQLFSSDVRNLLTRTKVSTLLHDKPLVILRQETTVELALQARQYRMRGVHYRAQVLTGALVLCRPWLGARSCLRQSWLRQIMWIL